MIQVDAVELGHWFKHFAGDMLVLLKGQNYRGAELQRGRQVTVTIAETHSQMWQAARQPAHSGVLLLTGHRRTNRKGMLDLVTGQVRRRVE